MSHPRNWIVAIVCCLLGLRIIAHVRRNAVGWVILAMGACAAVAVGAEAWGMEHWLAWIGTWVWWPSYSLVSIVSLIFPNGRLLSSWWWWLVFVVGVVGILLPVIGIGWASWSSPATFWDDAVHGTARRGLPVQLAVAGLGCFVLGSLGAIVALAVRCRRAVDDQRRLLLWAVACALLALLALFFELLGTVWGAWGVVAAAFPTAALVAILRYGLYDIDLLIHRTVLYGLLVSILVGSYIAVVLVATAPFPGQAHVIGTVAVVLALAPLHRVLRGRVDRGLYGDRADPYRALTQLGRQLENPLLPDEVFSAVARTVAEALKLPYVAVSLDIGGQSQLLARYGRSRDWPWFRIPMTHRGMDVGEFIVEVRAPEERFGPRERHLLADLARQVAPAAQSARLARELQRANVRFEQEREEDLLQLTRDLHDGIGPSLAGVRLQVDAVRKLLGDGKPRLHRQLERAIDDLKSISSEVRVLVNTVRPRDLHLGLLDAVRRQAERFDGPDFAVCVTADGSVEQLPPAVELAAYRIISEALNNVAQHANARSGRVLLSRKTDDLRVSIIDDGDGISPNVIAGVGLASMRKRCEDLGGTFAITSLPKGTRIVACLPLGRD